MKTIFLFAILLATSSCTTVEHRKRVIYYDGKNKPQSEVELVDGKRSGNFTLWYPNGAKKAVCQKLTITQTQCQHFYQSGNLLRQYQLQGETLNGSFIEYYADATAYISGQFRNGAQIGTWQFFTPHTKLLKTMTYRNNALVSQHPANAVQCPELLPVELEARAQFQFSGVQNWCEKHSAVYPFESAGIGPFTPHHLTY